MHFTKLIVLLAAFALACKVGAQPSWEQVTDDDDVLTRFSEISDDTTDSDDGMIIPEFFHMPAPPTQPPPFFPPDIFSSLFQNLFSDDGFDEEPTVIRMTITSTDDSQEQEQPEQEEDENPLSRFSTVFQRMASLIENVRMMQSMSPLQDQTDSSVPLHRDCPLLRACADEIDQYCSTERLSQISGALPLCLHQHSSELSESCAAVVDKRIGGDDEEENEQEDDENENATGVTVVEIPNEDESDMPEAEEEQPEEEQPEESVNDLLEPSIEEPMPTPAPEEPSQSDRPCAQDVNTYCSEEKANMKQTGLVGVMACLHRHKDSLSATCLSAVSPTPAFHCAEDAQRLCPDVHGRHNIARCLHRQSEQVSQECKDAAHQHARAADETPQAVRFATVNAPVAVAAATGAAAAAQESLPSHVLPMAIVGGGFVLIVSLVAVVVSYRRRRAREELPITITFSNPTQAAVDMSAQPIRV